MHAANDFASTSDLTLDIIHFQQVPRQPTEPSDTTREHNTSSERQCHSTKEPDSAGSGKAVKGTSYEPPRIDDILSDSAH